MNAGFDTSATDRENSELLTAYEVSRWLRVDMSWVKNHSTRVEPLLPSIKFGKSKRSSRRYVRSQVQDFINQHMVTGNRNLRRLR